MVREVLAIVGGLPGIFICCLSGVIVEVFGESFWQPGPRSGIVLFLLILFVLLGVILLFIGRRSSNKEGKDDKEDSF